MADRDGHDLLGYRMGRSRLRNESWRGVFVHYWRRTVSIGGACQDDVQSGEPTVRSTYTTKRR